MKTDLKYAMSWIIRLGYLTIIYSTIFGISLWCYSAQAQEPIPQKVVNASTPNPVGSGARAMGMGGAFIAVADDATAASWNPAGLTQLKRPELSFALSYFHRRDDFDSEFHPETSGVEKSWSRDLNYLSAAYPFKFLDRNMIVSLNYQLLYEFNRSISTNINSKSLYPPVRFNQKVDFDQEGDLKTLSPAFAIEITPNFSIGITFNIWTDNLFWSNGWESDTNIKGKTYQFGVLTSKVDSKDHDRYYEFSGYNGNFGFLWNINQHLTVGGVFKAPFTADVKHERVQIDKVRVPGFPEIKKKWRTDEDIDIDMPMSYGLGVAWRFTDAFSMSLDVYRTEWDHFRLEDGKGNHLNPITGKPHHESRTDETNQVRLGGEYLFIFPKTVIPLRAGIFYDPEPSRKSPEDFWGATIGSGVSLGPLIFDCAYQFRFGKDVAGDVFNIPSTTADVTQHLVVISFIYHF